MAAIAAVVFARAGAGAIAVPAVPHFVDETDAAGMQSRFDGEWEYTVGGGVAAFDCDGSGLPSLFIAGGANRSKFYRNRASRGGALKFVLERAGLELTSTLGAYPIDLDGDGVLDLVVLRVGETLLMRGLGDCRFERANESWDFEGGNQWTTAFAAAWLGRRDASDARLRHLCRPHAPGLPLGQLHRQPARAPGARRGARVRAPLALGPATARSACCSRTGTAAALPALRITNDREYYKGGQEQLWHIQPGAAPRLFGAGEGWQPLQIWGMGIASADLDGSGYPAYFLTSMADNKLQVLACGRRQAAVPRHRVRQRRQRRTAPSPAATCIHRPPGMRSSRTSTTTAGRTSSS